MDRVWVGHCFKNLDPDEVGQDAGPQGVAFPDSVLGSLGLARLGDVTEMVQTFTWPMPHIFLKEIFSRASYLNTPPRFSVEPRLAYPCLLSLFSSKTQGPQRLAYFLSVLFPLH